MVWWEMVFMLIVLKIPIVYLCAVVWWAIKAEPLPEEGASVGVDGPDFDGPPRWWRPSRGRRRPGPHAGPARAAPRRARAAFARGKVER
jgi:hypothetical protein